MHECSHRFSADSDMTRSGLFKDHMVAFISALEMAKLITMLCFGLVFFYTPLIPLRRILSVF